MNSAYALKRLKKKSQKLNVSISQLQHLKQDIKKTCFTQQYSLKQDVVYLSQEVLSDVVSELVKPFQPLLSWFGLSHDVLRYQKPRSLGAFVDPQVDKPSKPVQKIGSISLARIPLNSPACKKCPALQGGLCRCAQKKLSTV
ncbi:MAG: hypothetical protein CENE_01446 [Candidatus Celerinatantimonas neptuna]|nr:MAG: hypothetical protein CENE_01446 [Candidatus Celerinatantimonas neptuna]